MHANKYVSKSLISILDKNESLFRITGERLKEFGFKNNKISKKLLDDILKYNPELVGIVIVGSNGNPKIITSNLNIENIPNLLQKEETKNSFIKAMNSDSLVLGRTYFVDEVKEWIVPIRFRILNDEGQVEAVFTTGFRIKGNNSPWESFETKDTLRVSVIGVNNYFQFASFVKPETLSSVYSTPLSEDFLNSFDEKLFSEKGINIDDFKNSDLGIVDIEYQGPKGNDLVATFSYNNKYQHYIFTTVLKANLLDKFKTTMFWLTALILGFLTLLFWLFKQMSQIQRKSKSDLIYQSHHDLLTGLYNLRFLSDNFNKWRRKQKKPFAFIFIDLDNFKNCNDVHGHSVGDDILAIVAHRIETFFKNSLCIRQGGDEFIVLTSSLNNDYEGFLNTLKQPMEIDDLTFSIRASIGVAQSPQDGKDLSTLMRKADIAMYEAKRKKCGVNIFTPQLEKRNTRSAMIAKELNHAIENKELSLVYQPQIELSTKRMIGAEVLLRWDNEVLHKVSPSEFIPIAESTGSILEIGKYVFEKTFKEFHSICSNLLLNDRTLENKQKFRLSINVSIMQLSNSNFLEHLLKLYEKFSCNNIRLVLEITETLIIANPDKVGNILSKIRQAGIEISLDDFGTGYSSLSYLINLPINELKIDKGFIHSLTSCTNSHTLIKSIINLGSNLGLNVIAEGVETKQQLDILDRYGCKFIQGYLFSKPLKKDDFINYFENSQ